MLSYSAAMADPSQDVPVDARTKDAALEAAEEKPTDAAPRAGEGKPADAQKATGGADEPPAKRQALENAGSDDDPPPSPSWSFLVPSPCDSCPGHISEDDESSQVQIRAPHDGESTESASCCSDSESDTFCQTDVEYAESENCED